MPIDIDSPFSLTHGQIRRYRENGFIKLKNVLSTETLDYYGREITQKVIELNPNRKPLAERDTYHKAFIQITNLWETSGQNRGGIDGSERRAATPRPGAV
ncbi:MAG: hypothetical protein ACE5I1_26600 [bacterium]